MIPLFGPLVMKATIFLIITYFWPKYEKLVGSERFGDLFAIQSVWSVAE
jgi:hypothetical protein